MLRVESVRVACGPIVAESVAVEGWAAARAAGTAADQGQENERESPSGEQHGPDHSGPSIG